MIKMEERQFCSQENKPNIENLQNIFKKAFSFYIKLNEVTKEYKHEWNFSKTGGWMEKVADKKKALYYLIPLAASFKISLTIRENERKDFIENTEMNEYKKDVEEAKKYSEGYNLQFIVNNETAYEYYLKFIKHIMDLRK
jgi:hypothetical protein